MRKPDNWYHEEWTPERVAAFTPVRLAHSYGPPAVRHAFETMVPKRHQDWARETIRANRVGGDCISAWTLPVLSGDACRYIVERSNAYKWEENVEGEAEAVRMPEAVLADKDVELCADVLAAFMITLSPWFLLIWQRLPTSLNSIQLARYNTIERPGGNWHWDRSSNFTAVTSLAPMAFTGGGTELSDGCLATITVPKLDRGRALVFDGRRVIHQGMPVTSGDRRLLVFWASDDQP